MTTFEITRTDIRAIDIAADELEAYIDVVGNEDEHHEIQAWSLRRLRALLDRFAQHVEQHGDDR